MMTTERHKEENFAAAIAAAVCAAYKTLPKKGKPQVNKEWTLLSGIVLCNGTDSCSGQKGTKEIKVVALGTGSKCMGKSQVGIKGDVIRDSHAEVIARRSFLLYLYNELDKSNAGSESEVFTAPTQTSGWKCAVRPEVSFHFFTSHTPCGDGSIIPKPMVGHQSRPDHISQTPEVDKESRHIDDNNDDVVNGCIKCNDSHRAVKLSNRKRKFDGRMGRGQDDQVGDVCVAKMLRTDGKDHNIHPFCDKGDFLSLQDDIYRTGAKCVPHDTPDPMVGGSGYHTVGVLRTKPGRGERTDCMSCSDKLAKWGIVGCQGALLSLLISHPIYWDSIIVGRCPYSQQSMERAINQRVTNLKGKLPSSYYISCPSLLQTNAYEFASSRYVLSQQRNEGTPVDGGIKNTSFKIVPSPAAISWHHTDGHELAAGHDVIVHGKRQGIVKADLDKPKARSVICSMSLFQRFLLLVETIDIDKRPSELRCDNLATMTYCDVKQKATDYQRAWSMLVKESFPRWVRKPQIVTQFTIKI